jgi:DNA-3-methyladenine glycosylase II
MAMIPTTASEKHLRWIAGSPLIRGYPQAFGQTIWQADRRSWVFPTANAIAKASLRDLRTCGLSHRKAEYVKDFARCVANGDLALEALKYQTDVEVSDRLMRCRGFGAWSAQYFLLRRLSRLDSLPADDIGLRRTVGSYLARRRRLTPRQLERGLAPFAPFRGLAAFYLAVDSRLQRHKSVQAGRQ